MADLPAPVRPPDELSPVDYLMHRGEAQPATRSAFLNVEILDRPADWGRLREAIDRATRVVIRMRQKVVIPPVPTTPPRWVVDPDFDLDYHLRRIALPAPGTLRQLLDLAELTLQSPLDLPETAVTAGRRALGGAATTVSRLVRRPGSTLRNAIGFADSARRVLGPPPVPPSPLLRRRSLVSRTVVLEVPLADLRAAAKAVGGSVNDAYLAALSGGLGRYHEALGVPVDALPLTLPVSLRTGDDPASGNRFAGATIAAPIGEPDPAERMRLIREQVIARRSEPAIDLIGQIAPALSLLPDGALEMISQRINVPDIQASNVPGYGAETFLAGAKVERQYAIGPLPRVAMMAILVSRAGVCTVTVRYDTASFTAADELEKGLQLGFDEVLELGRPQPRPAARRARGRRTP